MRRIVYSLVFVLIVSIPWQAVADPPKSRNRVALLKSGLPGSDARFAVAIAKELRDRGFVVTELTASDVCNKEVLTPENYFLFLIPDCQSYPAAGIEPLVSFARGGGHLMFVGGPFLDKAVWRHNGEWLDREAIARKKQNALPQYHSFGRTKLSTAGWIRACSDLKTRSTWATSLEGPNGIGCFKLWTENYIGWEGNLSPAVAHLYGSGHDLFTFQARGAPQTKQLAVEIQETDGSRWLAVADLGTKWQRISLEPSDFHYWPDSSSRRKRGGKGDHLQPQQAIRVNFQIANSHTAELPPGEHSFWIADIGTCPNPTAALQQVELAATQTLETILPRYKVYQVNESVVVRTTSAQLGLPSRDSDKPIAFNVDAGTDLAAGLVCAIPRTMGNGFGRGQKWRYVPLMKAEDKQGQPRGAPAWLLLNRSGPFKGSSFSCLGFNDPETLLARPCLTFTADLVRRLQQGVFLLEAGAEHFAYWPGEKIKVGALVRNMSALPQSVALNVVLRDQRGRQSWTATTTLDVAANQESSWQQVISQSDLSRSDSSRASLRPGVYQISTEIQVNGTVLDRVDHDVTVLETGQPAKREYVKIKGSDFYLGDQKWYPVGINFWPLYVSGMDREDFWADWISRAYYEPDLVEQDLVRMESLGINMVSIQSGDPKYYRNLLDFTRRCSRHGIRVNLFCGLASPLAFRERELRQFIETARLADNPTIIAYDTIWEPGNYVFQDNWRSRWDDEWRAWLTEQYGTVQAAEVEWQFEGRRDPQGNIISPPDKYFRQDGPWRTMLAAYRRFMDDSTSQKWGRAHRRLREIDPNHLISFRQGNTLPHDFTFTGTPKHIDFICPEGYSISASQDGYDTAGFITRYVHFTTGGKPIIWSEFGKSVWKSQTMAPSRDLIDAASSYHELFYKMVLESGANGTVPWWWPGGYRVGERSDFGIVGPDGNPRPAAELIERYGPQLKTDRHWPSPNAWFDLDRDAHAGGYWYICFNTGRDAYRKAVAAGRNLGVRTAGTGTSSATVPAVAVGNRPWSDRNPAKYLNAEFNWLRIQDASGRWVEARDGVTITVQSQAPVKARICLGNTQEAQWVASQDGQLHPGDVVLGTTKDSAIDGRWLLPTSTPYLSDADFGEVTLSAKVSVPVDVELRMAVIGRFGFGEKRTFRLVPKEPFGNNPL